MKVWLFKALDDMDFVWASNLKECLEVLEQQHLSDLEVYDNIETMTIEELKKDYDSVADYLEGLDLSKPQFIYTNVFLITSQYEDYVTERRTNHV